MISPGGVSTARQYKLAIAVGALGNAIAPQSEIHLGMPKRTAAAIASDVGAVHGDGFSSLVVHGLSFSCVDHRLGE